MTISSGADASVEYVYASTLAGLANSPLSAGSPQQVVGTGVEQLLDPMTKANIPTGSYFVQAVVTLPDGSKVYSTAQPFTIDAPLLREDIKILPVESRHGIYSYVEDSKKVRVVYTPRLWVLFVCFFVVIYRL